MLVPAVTVVVFSVLVTLTLAPPATVTVVLADTPGDGVAEDVYWAVFVSGPEGALALTWSTIVKLSVSFAGRLPLSRNWTCPVPPGGGVLMVNGVGLVGSAAADTKVVFIGVASLIRTEKSPVLSCWIWIA